jgi:hypothetical protein
MSTSYHDSDSDSADGLGVSEELIECMKTYLRQSELSKRLLKKIMEFDENPVCMCCSKQCLSRNQLKKHLKKCKDHKYGIERLRSDKKFFCEDLKNSHPDWDLPDFRAVHGLFVDMEDEEQTEYCKILLLTMLQIRV